MENLKYIVYEESKYYVSQCLNVEVSSFGETKKEALFNLKEALELYFEGSEDYNCNEIEEVSTLS